MAPATRTRREGGSARSRESSITRPILDRGRERRPFKDARISGSTTTNPPGTTSRDSSSTVPGAPPPLATSRQLLVSSSPRIARPQRDLASTLAGSRPTRHRHLVSTTSVLTNRDGDADKVCGPEPGYLQTVNADLGTSVDDCRTWSRAACTPPEPIAVPDPTKPDLSLRCPRGIARRPAGGPNQSLILGSHAAYTTAEVMLKQFAAKAVDHLSRPTSSMAVSPLRTPCWTLWERSFELRRFLRAAMSSSHRAQSHHSKSVWRPDYRCFSRSGWP